MVQSPYILLLFCCTVLVSNAYKPIIFYHGFGGYATDFSGMQNLIKQVHPGTPMYPLALFEGTDSYTPMWKQVNTVLETIRSLKTQHNFDSFHLICHSQGALVCRVVLQLMDDNTCDTFCSMAGPQMGQYGVIGFFKDFFPGITTEFAYELLYNSVVQSWFSASNYWHDPHEEAMYLANVIFLPIVNNETTTNGNSTVWKRNFIKTKTVALFGGPDDGTIQPWQSCFFSFWNKNQQAIVPMEAEDIYVKDWIGLHTLDKSGRLFQVQVSGVTHGQFIRNTTFISKYVVHLLT